MISLAFTGGEGLAERMSALNFLPIVEAEVIRGIRENVAHGLDAGGSAMAEYTEQYKKYGRIRKGLSVSPVNLRVKTEDSLLDTLGAVRTDKNNSVVSVRADKEKIAQGLSEKRHFMGITPSALARVEQSLEQEFMRMFQ